MGRHSNAQKLTGFTKYKFLFDRLILTWFSSSSSVLKKPAIGLANHRRWSAFQARNTRTPRDARRQIFAELAVPARVTPQRGVRNWNSLAPNERQEISQLAGRDRNCDPRHVTCGQKNPRYSQMVMVIYSSNLKQQTSVNLISSNKNSFK